MLRRVLPALTAAVALSLSSPATAADEGEAVVLRIDRPADRLREALALFDGARAPHPAAALAAWRQATGRHDAPSKAVQALIAALNPGMVPELARLEGAAARLAFPPGSAAPRWSVALPRDDGTFADLATALALTDGETAGDVARLARGPSAPVAARRPAGGFAFASDPDTLARVLAADPAAPSRLEGWDLALVPGALAADRAGADAATVPADAARLARWRAAAALEALGCRELRARVRLADGDTLLVETLATTGGTPETDRRGPPPAVDPAWLDWAPGEQRTAALACLALDPDASTFDLLADALDRVEKADPSRSKAAPVRARADLLALAAGVRPAALRAPLRGLSAIIGRDGANPGALPPAAVVLHTASSGAAEGLARAIARAVSRREPAAGPEGAILPLGPVAGRTIEVGRVGADVVVGWGPGWALACVEAHAHPDAASWPELRSALGPATSRAGAAWPGRLGGIGPDGPLAAALNGSPPIVWTGTSASPGSGATDVVTWPGLRPTVRRFLDRLPMSPTRTGAVRAATELAP